MQYKSNEDVIREIKAAAAREGLSLSGLARLFGIKQPTFSGWIHKKQLSFSDVSRIAAALGYRLHFELIKDQDQTPATTAPGDDQRL